MSVSSQSQPYKIMLFCRVVDNYGDIAICWRLARQFAAEFSAEVTLWVDELNTFQHLLPEVNPKLKSQKIHGVEVLHWVDSDLHKNHSEIQERLNSFQVDLVIETFGCNLPDVVVSLMHKAQRKPVWINLEYLSAENWVEGCHALPSPQKGLDKYFFFPGFSANTGGLIREATAFDRFQRLQDRERWLLQHLKTNPQAESILISLFSYENSRLEGLLTAWSHSTKPVHVFASIGVIDQSLSVLRKFFNQNEWSVWDTVNRKQVTLTLIPFLTQDNYDVFLAQMDINFVRGEDSFVRAQWALRPFVWQIYPQNEKGHLMKLQAFLMQYGANLSEDAREGLIDFWSYWNGVAEGDAVNLWEAFMQHFDAYVCHAQKWEKLQIAHGNLAENIWEFAQSKR